MNFDLRIPPLLRIGAGSIESIGELTAAVGSRRPLIVTDSYLTSNGTAGRVADLLAAGGAQAEIYDGTIPDPTTASLSDGLVALKRHDADSIVALGGGSPIDTAKALAVLAVRGGSMSDLKAPYRYEGPTLPVIAIPTTAGTGSECTMFTIITDSASGEKMLCAGPSYMPSAAVVDYQLTRSMPPRLTADTGIDALTHAVEAYVSRKANAVSDTFGLAAIARIGKHLRTAYTDGADETARGEMMLAATMAGVAFSNASVALVHGMSRPLGARFHIAHGMANAMLFAEVTAFSLSAAEDRYADCARTLGVANADESDAEAAAALVRELRRLSTDLEVPTPARHGIDRADWDAALPTMAQQAIASGSPANNPRIPSVEDIEGIYQRIFA